MVKEDKKFIMRRGKEIEMNEKVEFFRHFLVRRIPSEVGNV